MSSYPPFHLFTACNHFDICKISDHFGFEDIGYSDIDSKRNKLNSQGGLSQFLHNSIQEDTVGNLLDYFRKAFAADESVIPSNALLKYSLLIETGVC